MEKLERKLRMIDKNAKGQLEREIAVMKKLVSFF